MSALFRGASCREPSPSSLPTAFWADDSACHGRRVGNSEKEVGRAAKFNWPLERCRQVSECLIICAVTTLCPISGAMPRLRAQLLPSPPFYEPLPTVLITPCSLYSLSPINRLRHHFSIDCRSFACIPILGLINIWSRKVSRVFPTRFLLSSPYERP